jgi:hypothetical protein
MSPALGQTVMVSDGANTPRQSNIFNVEAANLTVPNVATGGQAVSVTFLLAGVTTAYLVWTNGSTEVGGRVPINGTAGAITAPATAGTYTLAIWDSATAGTGILLASSSAIAVAAALPESITITTPSSVPISQALTVSGLYTNGPPSGLAWSIDGTNFTAAASPAIAAGAFSFVIPPGTIPAGGPYTLRVRDSGSPAVVGTASGGFMIESGTLGALPSFLAGQSSLVTFTLSGITTAYLAWWSGSSDVGSRVAASGSSTAIVAPASGTYTLRLYDSATGSTILDSRSGIVVVAETITVSTPASAPATAAVTIAGTYANATPTALDWSINGGTTWTAAASPAISSGVYSFSVPPGGIAAGTNYTLLVRDHTTGTQASASTTFSVYSANFTNAPSGAPGAAVVVNFALVGISTVYLVWTQGSSELASRIPVSGTSATITAPAAGGYTLAIYDTSSAGTGNLLASVVVTIATLGPAADSGLTSIGIPNALVMFDTSNALTTFADSAFTTAQSTNGGVVKGLRDTSGNGYDLYQTTANAPTLVTNVQSSRNGLMFSKSASQFLQQVSVGWVSGLQSSPLTMLAVCKMTSDASSGAPYVAASIASSTNVDAHNAFGVNASTTGTPSVQAARHTATFGSAKDTSLGASAKNALLKIIARFDPMNNLVHIMVNGHSDISSPTTGPYTGLSLALWDNFLIGKQPAGSTPFYFDGYIFEVDVWTTFLSDSTKLNSLMSYATTKWGS